MKLEQFEVIVARWFPGFTIPPLTTRQKDRPMNTDLTPAVIDKIEAISDKSKHTIVSRPNSTERILRYADGHERLLVEQPIRQHEIGAIADIKPYLDYAKENLFAFPCVWIGKNAITVTLNDLSESTRNDIARMIFESSAEAKFLLSLKDTQFSQGQFLKLCRVKLYDCFQSTDDRLRWIAMLKTVARESTVSQGTQANYATNRAEQEWPDFLVLNIRVIEDPYLATCSPHTVRVHVEVSPNGMFELTVNTADLKAAIDAEIAYLVNHLRETAKDYPIFRGEP